MEMNYPTPETNNMADAGEWLQGTREVNTARRLKKERRQKEKAALDEQNEKFREMINRNR